MSWSRGSRPGRATDPAPWSRRAALAALAALPACGFAPVYGPSGAARGLSGRIAVDPPRDEGGYLFVRAVESRIGRAADPAYRLAADLSVSPEGLGRTPAGDITRVRLNGTLAYSLIDTASGRQVKSGRIADFTAYSSPVVGRTRTSIAGNPVTVGTARRDALERLMTILADGLVAELLATAPDWRR